jgi:hypothetical protein
VPGLGARLATQWRVVNPNTRPQFSVDVFLGGATYDF